VQSGDEQLLRRHIAEVFGEDHRLVISEHDMCPSPGASRLALQPVHEPQRAGDVGTPVEDVAEKDDMPVAPYPARLVVQEVRVGEKPAQAVVFPMDVADHEEGVDAGQLTRVRLGLGGEVESRRVKPRLDGAVAQLDVRGRPGKGDVVRARLGRLDVQQDRVASQHPKDARRCPRGQPTDTDLPTGVGDAKPVRTLGLHLSGSDSGAQAQRDEGDGAKGGLQGQRVDAVHPPERALG
jgi:hypothetical protein